MCELKNFLVRIIIVLFGNEIDSIACNLTFCVGSFWIDHTHNNYDNMKFYNFIVVHCTDYIYYKQWKSFNS